MGKVEGMKTVGTTAWPQMSRTVHFGISIPLVPLNNK